MDVSFEITGLDSIAQGSERVKQAVADEINKAVYASAQKVSTEAKKSILDGNKSGRIDNRRRSGSVIGTAVNFNNGVVAAEGSFRGGFHRASAPGEAPASDTGRLVNSINSYAVGNGEAISVAGRGTVKYATMLEFGTSKMAARPFMFPALEKSKAWISARIQDAVRRGIEAAKK